ncbi:hypothetical protein DUNSADRAFT_16293 [Dunaliella salina]|uniref:AMP-activated protein kinase glycogen-binding domain-containing protein n=1 Tax=Dunaliella salina TaxID=3046 RepID=A0ABQ7G3W0_DUNSA|nr:hypothetical protein DUNSADRAFT_16293 [Dunaliella salina]|eukprot:KAF5829295.1 hypothetical protein DUNSADRAFT_16293 [Dunaliella salina]
MGNAPAKDVPHEHQGSYMGGASSPSAVTVSPSVGSPLTYSPQVPMIAPIPKEASFRPRLEPEFHGITGWPATPKLMPVVIVWGHGGNHVEVEGSFDNWSTRQILQRTGKDFTIIKLLPPGVYQVRVFSIAQGQGHGCFYCS